MANTFRGRDAVLDSLRQGLADGPVLVDGARGIGKSRILTEFEACPPPDRPVLRFDLQGVVSPEKLRDRMRFHVRLRRWWFEEQLAELFGGNASGDPWEDLEQLLAVRERDCIVVFDEVALYLTEIARRDRERARTDLVRLDRMGCTLADVRVVLAGSVRLQAVASRLEVPLSPRWRTIAVGPLDVAAGQALFVEACAVVCDEATIAEANRLAGGNPRWIERIAHAMSGPPEVALTLDHLENAVERLLDANAFGDELGHAERHADPARLRHGLRLAAIPGADRTSVIAGLQSRMTRQEAEHVVRTLSDEFFLDAHGCLTPPLFARWLGRML